MEIWVKIKQLISILFCGYRRRMPTTIADASRNLYSPGAQGAPASNKAHRNQNNIPTLYILEIDSSVFKSVQKFHLLFAGLYKKIF